MELPLWWNWQDSRLIDNILEINACEQHPKIFFPYKIIFIMFTFSLFKLLSLKLCHLYSFLSTFPFFQSISVTVSQVLLYSSIFFFFQKWPFLTRGQFEGCPLLYFLIVLPQCLQVCISLYYCQAQAYKLQYRIVFFSLELPKNAVELSLPCSFNWPTDLN